MSLRSSSVLLLLALLAAPASVAAADAAASTAIGGAGELYELTAGSYGELFPEGTDAAANHRVLALDVRTAEGSERLLVPGTGEADWESWTALLVDHRSDRLFLVWESQHNGIHPLLHLISFDGTEWSPLVEITHNPFVAKRSPRLLVTRDEYLDHGSHRRAVLHLVWTEIVEPAGHESYYAALSLEDGAFLGSSPIHSLDALLADAPAPGAGGTTGGLAGQIEILSGPDARSAVVVFTSPQRGEIVSVLVDTLPLELTRLADEARAKIIDIGARLGTSNWTGIAQALHDELLADPRAFHPEIVRSIADEARAKIIDIGIQAPTTEIRVVADEARAKIIDIGFKLSDRGLRSVVAEVSSTEPALLDLTAVGDESMSRQLASARVVSRRAMPDVEIGENAFVIASKDGSQVAIAWVDGSRLSYVESQGDGWSAQRGLPFSQQMGAGEARSLLERRLSGR